MVIRFGPYDYKPDEFSKEAGKKRYISDTDIIVEGDASCKLMKPMYVYHHGGGGGGGVGRDGL